MGWYICECMRKLSVLKEIKRITFLHNSNGGTQFRGIERMKDRADLEAEFRPTMSDIQCQCLGSFDIRIWSLVKELELK